MQQAVGHLHQLIRLGGGLSPLTRRRGYSSALWSAGLIGSGNSISWPNIASIIELDEPLAVVEPVVGNAILLALAGLGRLGGCRCGGRWHRAGSSTADHLQRQQAAAGEGELAGCLPQAFESAGTVAGDCTWLAAGTGPSRRTLRDCACCCWYCTSLEVVVIDAHIFALGAIHLVSYRPAAGVGLTPIGYIRRLRHRHLHITAPAGGNEKGSLSLPCRSCCHRGHCAGWETPSSRTSTRRSGARQAISAGLEPLLQLLPVIGEDLPRPSTRTLSANSPLAIR